MELRFIVWTLVAFFLLAAFPAAASDHRPHPPQDQRALDGTLFQKQHASAEAHAGDVVLDARWREAAATAFAQAGPCHDAGGVQTRGAGVAIGAPDPVCLMLELVKVRLLIDRQTSYAAAEEDLEAIAEILRNRTIWDRGWLGRVRHSIPVIRRIW